MDKESNTAIDEATRRALASLDTMADAWARGARLTEAVAKMLARDDRESRLEGFIKLAWTEGAWAGRRGLSIQEIEELGRGE
jgi:hypothetical protein